jgi:hypothetical protein
MQSGVSRPDPKALSRLEQTWISLQSGKAVTKKSNQGKLLPKEDASIRGRTIDPAMPFLVYSVTDSRSLHTPHPPGPQSP